MESDLWLAPRNAGFEKKKKWVRSRNYYAIVNKPVFNRFSHQMHKLFYS